MATNTTAKGKNDARNEKGIVVQKDLKEKIVGQRNRVIDL